MTALQKAAADRSAEIITINVLETRVLNHNLRTALLVKSGVETQTAIAWRCRNNLADIHRRIMHQTPADLQDHEVIYVELLDRIDKVITDLSIIMAELSQGAAVAAPTNINIKLPEMQLPKFTGNYEDWPSFEDLFQASVHSNSNLSGAQKLQYLQSCVNGEAARLIKSFQITNGNYSEAWSQLQSRYNNKREIIFQLVKKILFQAQLKTENSTALQQLLDTTQECLRSLKVLGCPTDQWDHILVVCLAEKMDPDTKSEWARSLTGTSPPTFQELVTFVENHLRALIARGTLTTRVTAHKVDFHAKQPRQPSRNFHVVTSICVLCKGTHILQHCPEFLSLTPSARFAAVKRTSSCLNCLRHHFVKDCTSQSSCKVCHKWHHSLLHFDSNSKAGGNEGAKDKPDAPGTPAVPKKSLHVAADALPTTETLLKTALVFAVDKNGNKHPCRVLIDGGSEVSLITQSFANRMGLVLNRTSLTLEGVSAITAASPNHITTIKLLSRIRDASIDVEALVLKKVTGTVPKVPCLATLWSHLEDIQLADPTYSKPAEIDMLLGADVEASILIDGLRIGPRNTPMAQNSIFGWILSGRVPVSPSTNIVRSFHTCCSLQDMVQRFWKTEEPPSTVTLTTEEKECEDYFAATTTRKEDGRYVVRLPFRKDEDSIRLIDNIGDTRALAERRLFGLETRFKRHPQHHAAYREFMNEYLQLDHMELVDPNAVTSVPPVYIPHHFVTKEDSSTTKLRVVFDASMQATNGISLNKCLLVGPTIQDDLFSLLVRFRFNVVAFKADIAKMYRQFEIHEADRDCQRILWRDTPQQPIKEYRLKTVTYGTASAPFLATRCLKQLAEDERHKFPAASSLLKSDSYVDDILSGAPTTTAAIELVREIISLISAGGMHIRKWCSNDPLLMDSIPEELRETGSALTFDEFAAIKALGVTWQPTQDVFTFYTKTNPIAVTKSDLLSEIAKTFDPLGWLSPFTINNKILFQSLWTEDINWNDVISEQHQEKWRDYQQQLTLLSNLQIPRCVVGSNVLSYHLVGFCDASEKAFASAVYLRCELADGTILVNLIASRTRVAPLVQKCIPRLELDSAVLLVETVESISNAIPNNNFVIRYYTDNTTVLKWLASPSRRWKTYVANRVAKIQAASDIKQWHHVRTEENPADLPSRGITVQELIDSHLWWHGPRWIQDRELPCSSKARVNMEEVQLEEKKVAFQISVSQPAFINNWVSNFSSLRSLTTTTAVFQLYCNYLRNKQLYSKKLIITAAMRKHALNTLIRLIQAESFFEELIALKKGHEVKRSSNLKSLIPFVDRDNIIRVGGRLDNANIPVGMKHPLVLPKHCHFNNLLIQSVHREQLHCGTTLTLATLRQNYWLISGKEQVKRVIGLCITCKRVKGETMKQLMGQLPAARVTPCRPFLHSGVDFAGPFMVKAKKGRGQRGEKCWFAIFVCMATKAIHLEVVTSLSTEAFMACFRRFTSRRGVASDVYSDCGTNFVGADREIQQFIRQQHIDFQNQLAVIGITWHFNPPGSPHINGLNEAGVKSVKFHLRRVMGINMLTMEQFQTLLCNIEACLNSRPLISLSNNISDCSVLTPGHFLIGSPITAIPEPNLLDVKENTLSYWQEVQNRTQHFWKRWSLEYLTSLQQRWRWIRKQQNLGVGDLVTIKDENIPPARWKLGRVIAVHPGQDGLVRRATIRVVTSGSTNPVKFNEITRAIQKLCPLLTNNEMR